MMRLLRLSSSHELLPLKKLITIGILVVWQFGGIAQLLLLLGERDVLQLIEAAAGTAGGNHLTRGHAA